jgi:glycolate oxidase FAD binding subunit
VDRSVREVTDAHPGSASSVLSDTAAETVYDHLAGLKATGQGGAAGVAVRASTPISHALDLVEAAERCARRADLTVSHRAGAARGRVDLVLSDQRAAGAPEECEADRFASCVTQMRAEAVALGGSLFVTQGSTLLPADFDSWGDVGPALALMRRIKERFDPNRILNPGRFVGGM